MRHGERVMADLATEARQFCGAFLSALTAGDAFRYQLDGMSLELQVVEGQRAWRKALDLRETMIGGPAGTRLALELAKEAATGTESFSTSWGSSLES